MGGVTSEILSGQLSIRSDRVSCLQQLLSQKNLHFQDPFSLQAQIMNRSIYSGASLLDPHQAGGGEALNLPEPGPLGTRPRDPVGIIATAVFDFVLVPYLELSSIRGFLKLTLLLLWTADIVFPPLQDKQAEEGWYDFKFEVVVKRSTSRK